jgi:hypothetical protein
MTDLSYESFATTLREQIPEFVSGQQDHIADYGEVLPHVLLGEFTRFLLEDIRSNGMSSEVAIRSLHFLESCASSSDSALQELVAVSFVENLEPTNDLHQRILHVSGPHLHRLSKEMWGR